MASFRLCYNLGKHTSDQDSILGLHPVSWVVAVIGPPIRMNICGIVSSDNGTEFRNVSFDEFCLEHVINQ
jgi:hypothetical protein